MRRSRTPFEPRCHWCKRPLVSSHRRPIRAHPRYTDFPDLPAGTGVLVCGAACPQRPAGAVAGTRFT